MRLFKIVEPLEEGDEVTYVGVYVLKWYRSPQEPTVGFTPASDEEVAKYLEDQGYQVVPPER